MDSKKRLMFMLEDDYYYITLKVLAILKALDCDTKPFEDYKKLGIIFEFIKNQSNINYLKKLMLNTQIDIFDKERMLDISCNASMNNAVIKRVIFFLEKQNMISIKKSLKGDFIEVLLLRSPQLFEMISDNVLDDDLIRIALVKSYIPRIRTLKISTLRKKIFGISEVSSWED